MSENYLLLQPKPVKLMYLEYSLLVCIDIVLWWQ